MVVTNMSRRTERIESLIRSTIGELLLSKFSDPRIDPARTSVTRVEVPKDLLSAKVFVSVMGSEGQQRSTMRALEHAAGRIQELMAERIQLRNTPVLTFELDLQFKKTLETYAVITRAMDEIHRKEEGQQQGEPAASQDAPAGAAPTGPADEKPPAGEDEDEDEDA